MANGTKPAQLTAIGLEPVLNPATCTRPERIASISAAFDWTGKNTTFWRRKSCHLLHDALVHERFRHVLADRSLVVAASEISGERLLADDVFSCLHVANKDYDAAAIANEARHRRVNSEE
jgi:hypothetical protein